jgi:hypothetical protein
VAFQAKGHAKGLGMVYFFHLVNASVALDATYPSVYVNGMIEIDVVGRLVNSNPRDGGAIVDTIAVDVLLGRKLTVSVGVFSEIRCPNGGEQRGVCLD